MWRVAVALLPRRCRDGVAQVSRAASLYRVLDAHDPRHHRESEGVTCIHICTKMLGALEVVSVILGRVVRVALVEGGVCGRPVHHLLPVHHVAHGRLGTVRAAGTGVREHCSI